MRELFTAKEAADPYNSGVYEKLRIRNSQHEWEMVCSEIEKSVFFGENQCVVRRISSDIRDRLVELGYEVEYHERRDQYTISWWESD